MWYQLFRFHIQQQQNLFDFLKWFKINEICFMISDSLFEYLARFLAHFLLHFNFLSNGIKLDPQFQIQFSIFHFKGFWDLMTIIISMSDGYYQHDVAFKTLSEPQYSARGIWDSQKLHKYPSKFDSWSPILLLRQLLALAKYKSFFHHQTKNQFAYDSSRPWLMVHELWPGEIKWFFKTVQRCAEGSIW